MGKVVLTSCGEQKDQVIKIVQEATGLSLKEAKDAVDSVEMGTPYTMDVPTELENSVIEQLNLIGASVSKGGSKFENRTNFSEEIPKETVSSFSNYTNPQNRDETLTVLYEVGRVAETLECLSSEIPTLKQSINSEKQKAEELRHAVSGKAKAIKWMAILCSLMTWDNVPVVFTIVIWIVMNETVIKKDLQEHEAENNDNADRYIVEHVNPLIEQLQKLESELEELNNSGKIEWAKDMVGENLFYSACIGDLYDLVKGRRADNLKEALNLYEDVQYKARMEEMQVAIQNASEVSAAEAVKQTAYSREIAKSSHQAATAAKENAYHAKQISRNTRRFR